MLKKTLFYRSWAEEAEVLMKDEAKVNAHPVYGNLRQLRYKENFLYSYEEIDKMLGLLFMNNQKNRMALDYFMAQMLLKGNMQGFQQYMGMVQQPVVLAVGLRLHSGTSRLSNLRPISFKNPPRYPAGRIFRIRENCLAFIWWFQK